MCSNVLRPLRPFLCYIAFTKQAIHYCMCGQCSFSISSYTQATSMPLSVRLQEYIAWEHIAKCLILCLKLGWWNSSIDRGEKWPSKPCKSSRLQSPYFLLVAIQWRMLQTQCTVSLASLCVVLCECNSHVAYTWYTFYLPFVGATENMYSISNHTAIYCKHPMRPLECFLFCVLLLTNFWINTCSE